MGYMEEYDWYLKNTLREYAGEWVVIVNKQVFAHGKDVKKMVDDARKKYPDKQPLIAKVPPNSLLML